MKLAKSLHLVSGILLLATAALCLVWYGGELLRFFPRPGAYVSLASRAAFVFSLFLGIFYTSRGVRIKRAGQYGRASLAVLAASLFASSLLVWVASGASDSSVLIDSLLAFAAAGALVLAVCSLPVDSSRLKPLKRR